MADSSSRNAERIKTYKENNPGVAKLNKLKYSVKVSERRASNSDFDKEWKEKEAARKRKYRAEKSHAKDEDVLDLKLLLLLAKLLLIQVMRREDRKTVPKKLSSYCGPPQTEEK